ncbi:GNAT family N-acetyltransferase [Ammonicoccus fulvus]|uniref:GNAT family N-acetyltransferase n=1 Tax=Ammonicoccus fulvus TaxID=3138240 RepID=A0ABZ3FQ22_9ACTN
MNSAESRPESVRLALPKEAASIADLQYRAWQADFADTPDLLAELEPTAMTEIWHQAITRPPVAACRVLVAVDTENRVVGFASTIPCEDPDAEAGADGAVGEFLIEESVRNQGHGSRLLNACVDTLRADGFTRATWWIRSTDDDLRKFLTESGWAPDGSHREIGLADGSVRIKQLRLHTDISDEPARA